MSQPKPPTTEAHRSDNSTAPAPAHASVPPAEPTAKTAWSRLPKWFQEMVTFFWEVVRRIFTALRSLLFLFVDTITMVLPSAALTSRRDDEAYVNNLRAELTGVLNALDLQPDQRDVILKNWLPQLIWTNNRANRERNANELIRWWQIILGVLIPVLTTPVAFGGVQTDGGATGLQNVGGVQIGAVMGIFVAVLTALAQFRRPEDRWRHYRILAENYLMEIWDYITLSNQAYKDIPQVTHQAAFATFNQRMTKLRRDDVNAFFSEVSSRPMDMEEMRREMASLKEYLASLQNPNPDPGVKPQA